MQLVSCVHPVIWAHCASLSSNWDLVIIHTFMTTSAGYVCGDFDRWCHTGGCILHWEQVWETQSQYHSPAQLHSLTQHTHTHWLPREEHCPWICGEQWSHELSLGVMSHDSHTIVTWWSHDSLTIVTWWSHDSHTIVTWWLHDKSHMMVTWWSHDSLTRVTWSWFHSSHVTVTCLYLLFLPPPLPLSTSHTQFLVLTLILYALFEVLYKKLATKKDDTAPVTNGLRFLGYMGVHTLLWLWPLLIVFHFTGVEVFELPTLDNLGLMTLNAFLDIIFNAGLLVCIALSSPLFAR